MTKGSFLISAALSGAALSCFSGEAERDPWAGCREYCNRLSECGYAERGCFPNCLTDRLDSDPVWCVVRAATCFRAAECVNILP